MEKNAQAVGNFIDPRVCLYREVGETNMKACDPGVCSFKAPFL
jgi:hypothetical protein